MITGVTELVRLSQLFVMIQLFAPDGELNTRLPIGKAFVYGLVTVRVAVIALVKYAVLPAPYPIT